jgi:hypothetical protein
VDLSVDGLVYGMPIPSPRGTRRTDMDRPRYPRHTGSQVVRDGGALARRVQWLWFQDDLAWLEERGLTDGFGRPCFAPGGRAPPLGGARCA